jgi:hypothetical protein
MQTNHINGKLKRMKNDMGCMSLLFRVPHFYSGIGSQKMVQWKTAHLMKGTPPPAICTAQKSAVSESCLI